MFYFKAAEITITNIVNVMYLCSKRPSPGPLSNVQDFNEPHPAPRLCTVYSLVKTDVRLINPTNVCNLVDSLDGLL